MQQKESDPKVSRRVRDSPHCHCQEYHKKTKLQHNNICGVGLTPDPCSVPNYWSSLCEPCAPRLVDSVGFHVVFLTPLALTIFPSPHLQDFPCSTYVSIGFCQFLEETFLMTIKLGSCLQVQQNITRDIYTELVF